MSDTRNRLPRRRQQALNRPKLSRSLQRSRTAKWELTGQRQSGKIGDADGYTILEDVTPLDLQDKNAVPKELSDFTERHKFSKIKHAVVLSPNGRKYSLKGWEASVNTELVGEVALEGAIVIHNHPTTPEEAKRRWKSLCLVIGGRRFSHRRIFHQRKPESCTTKRNTL